MDNIINNIKKNGLDKTGLLGESIHTFIQNSSEEDMRTLSSELTKIFMTKKDIDGFRRVKHESSSLVFRTIFGPLTRNGSVLDITHPDRTEGVKLNESLVNKGWEKAFCFCDMCISEFEKSNNKYGIMIILEMLGHRYVDLALSLDDKNSVECLKFIDEMRRYYIKAYEIAMEIECQKHSFSTWWWGGVYYKKLGYEKESIYWFKKWLAHVDKYMTDRQNTYKNNVKKGIDFLKDMMSIEDFKNDIFNRYKKSNNTYIKRFI